jgi:hypothetical protein
MEEKIVRLSKRQQIFSPELPFAMNRRIARQDTNYQFKMKSKMIKIDLLSSWLLEKVSIVM